MKTGLSETAKGSNHSSKPRQGKDSPSHGKEERGCREAGLESLKGIGSKSGPSAEHTQPSILVLSL